MFTIDRKYINQHGSEDSLQSNIIYLLSKYKNDSTLPVATDYNIEALEFEEYIDAKQEFTEWKNYYSQKGPVFLAFLFCVPPVIISFYDTGNTAFYLSFLASIIIILLVLAVFKMISKYKERSIINQHCEEYIAALLEWQKEHDIEE